jgi:rod shape determining protein RodA
MGILIAAISFNFLKDYQKKRILIYINPNLAPLSYGYHIHQARIAIGSGRLFGYGLFKGPSSHLGFLPERTTDFIFATISEEGGFLFSLLVCLLYLYLAKLGLSIASLSRNKFGSLLGVGLISCIVGKAYLNIAACLGIIPLVGIPLPLISYGGSCMVATLSSLGILYSIGRR